MTTYDLQHAVDADRKHLIHPLHHPSAHTAPKIWVKGQGSIMTDIEGKEYIDGLSGLWNVNVGHGRKELAEAAFTQMSTLAYASGYIGSATLPAIQLAERLAGLAYPQINHFFFTSGGGESNESAFKTARFFWKAQGKPDKVKVISRDFAYHGVTMAAMSATGLQAYWPMFEPRVPGFLHIPSPYPYYFQGDGSVPDGVAAANLLEEAILREGPDTVAAFIAEPVQGAGGVIVPQDEYFPRIREICDKYDVLFIADEVITGFGRTGRWFALDHWGVQPDIMAFAKGVTSGYLPLGGIGVSDRVHEAIMAADPGRRWMHAYTYSGHPTTCAVALANLDIFEKEDLVSRAAENGPYLHRQLRSALESHPNVGEVRGLGMLAAVEIVEDKAAKKTFDRSRKVGESIHAAAVEQGLVSRVRDDVYCLAPPLTTPRPELDLTVERLTQAVHSVLGTGTAV